MPHHMNGACSAKDCRANFVRYARASRNTITKAFRIDVTECSARCVSVIYLMLSPIEQ